MEVQVSDEKKPKDDVQSDGQKPTGADEHEVDLGKGVVEGTLPKPSEETASVDNTQKSEPERPSYLQKYIELAKGTLSDDEFNDFSTAVDQYYELHKGGKVTNPVAALNNALEYNEKYKNMSDKDKVNSVWATCLTDIIDSGKSSDFFKDFRKELECRLELPIMFGFRGAVERILTHYNEIMDKKGWFRFLDKSSDRPLGDLLKACRTLDNGSSSDIRKTYKQLEKLFSEAENKDNLVSRICLHLLLDRILYENITYFRDRAPDRFTIFTDKSEFLEAYGYYSKKREKIAPQDKIYKRISDEGMYFHVVYGL